MLTVKYSDFSLNTIINIFSNFLNPVGILLGMDGIILLAFILGFPANEIVIPIMMMGYLSNSHLVDISSIDTMKTILLSNGWTIKTALCTLAFILFHFPCSTTILTIKKETNSIKWTIISFIIPLLIGIILCLMINGIFNLIC